MFDYIKPNLIAKNIRDIVQEAQDYWVFYRAVKQIEKEGKFKQVNLRVTDWGAAYFVINLQPELLLYQRESTEEFKALELQKVKEALAQYNEFYCAQLLIDYVTTGYERIKTDDAYAYLVWIDFNYVYLKLDNIKKVAKQVGINLGAYTLALGALVWGIIRHIR